MPFDRLRPLAKRHLPAFAVSMGFGIIHDALRRVLCDVKAPKRIGQFSIRLNGDIAAVIAAHQTRNTPGFDARLLGKGFDQIGKRLSVCLGLACRIPILAFARVTDGNPGGHWWLRFAAQG